MCKIGRQAISEIQLIVVYDYGIWCLIFLSACIYGAAIPNDESNQIIFPEDFEKLKLKSVTNIREPSSTFVIANDTHGDFLTPIEVPDLSEGDAEQMLDALGFNLTGDSAEDIGVRFDDGTRSKILRYQKHFGLEPTGELDRDTKIALMMPRCGVSDVAAHGADYRWRKRSITYYIRNFPSGIAASAVKRHLRNAFSQWSRVTNLDFSESESTTADIEILFGGRYHQKRGQSCDSRFENNTLAHAQYPEGGTVHFNTKFYFGSKNEDSFFTTAMHEIGHAIGLDHSVSRASVMFSLNVRNFRELPQMDVEKIQLIYGKRNGKEDRSRYQPKPTPSFCSLSKYDAVTYDPDGTLRFIAGNYYYRIGNDQIANDAELLSEKWPGAPDKVDAASKIFSKIFIFKGTNVWAFKQGKLEPGFPTKIHKSFPGLPNNLDAITYFEQSYVYAFKADHYWRYNGKKGMVDHTGELSDFGVPSHIDAALYSSSQNQMFFFKGSTRYVYDFDTQNTRTYESRMFNC